MNKITEQPEVIVQHKITKIDGDIGFKRYVLGKLLGTGGFAKCYEATNIETKKKYALKVLEKVSMQKNRVKQKIISQIKIHKTLHHKHIVEVDSYFEDSSNVYILLELCSNKTLSQMVKKRKRLTAKQVRYFMLQLISALQHMHSNRVIHRDLKLGNIFLNSNMDIKVGDLGLATKLQFADEKKRTLCGTPNYIAPEIVEGSVGHSYEVDIWSAGIICYALLFGRPPFETNDVKLTYKKISKKLLLKNVGVPDEAKDFIKSILVIDPSRRATCKEMIAHPFLTHNVPAYLPQEALISTPTFKDNMGTKITQSAQKLNRENIVKNKNGDPVQQNPLSQEKVDQTSRREEHKIFIMAHVDYSKKYGLGYLTNNGYFGVYFNDNTLISTDNKKNMIYYLESPSAKEEKLQKYQFKQCPDNYLFKKKVMLLERFVTHLSEEIAKLPEKRNFQKDEKFIYVKKWFKTRMAIMFGLSSKLFQVNFTDNSQILLHTTMKTVFFTSKQGQTTYQLLNKALSPDNSQAQMTRRVQYTKEIVNSLRNKQSDKLEEPPLTLEGP